MFTIPSLNEIGPVDGFQFFEGGTHLKNLKYWYLHFKLLSSFKSTGV